MNELIKAAKAVIESVSSQWQKYGAVVNISEINRLSDAVKRAENPPADYNEWTARHSGQTVSPYELWTAAQQAERERIKEVIRAIGPRGRPDAWFDCVDTILERIDEC